MLVPVTNGFDDHADGVDRALEVVLVGCIYARWPVGRAFGSATVIGDQADLKGPGSSPFISTKGFLFGGVVELNVSTPNEGGGFLVSGGTTQRRYVLSDGWFFESKALTSGSSTLTWTYLPGAKSTTDGCADNPYQNVCRHVNSNGLSHLSTYPSIIESVTNAMESGSTFEMGLTTSAISLWPRGRYRHAAWTNEHADVFIFGGIGTGATTRDSEGFEVRELLLLSDLWAVPMAERAFNNRNVRPQAAGEPALDGLGPIEWYFLGGGFHVTTATGADCDDLAPSASVTLFDALPAGPSGWPTVGADGVLPQLPGTGPTGGRGTGRAAPPPVLPGDTHYEMGDKWPRPRHSAMAWTGDNPQEPCVSYRCVTHENAYIFGGWSDADVSPAHARRLDDDSRSTADPQGGFTIEPGTGEKPHGAAHLKDGGPVLGDLWQFEVPSISSELGDASEFSLATHVLGVPDAPDDEAAQGDELGAPTTVFDGAQASEVRRSRPVYRL